MNPNSFRATYQGDIVWFILDEAHREGIPDDAITYTLAEAEILAKKPPWTRRIAHEAKKHGAQLTLPNPNQPASYHQPRAVP
jgi:hypothetical protein